MDVLIHHSGLNRTVPVPAAAARAWAADGWEIATDEQAATYRGISAEEELAIAQEAEAEIAAAAVAEIQQDTPPSPSPRDTAATAGAVETATTNKEQKP